MAMPVYISILRGINVGGHNNAVRMDDLRKLYEGLGLRDAATYVQSGNVVFTADDADTSVLERKISGTLEETTGTPIPVIVMTVGKLERVIEKNPFVKDSTKNISFMHVTFLSHAPERYDVGQIEAKKQDGEEITFSDNVVYLYCPNGYGQTKLTNNLLEAKLKVRATTRNWKTVNELLKIARDIAATENK